MSQQTFRKWKPGVWAALSTGLYTLEDEEVPEETLVDHQHFSLEPTVSFFQRCLVTETSSFSLCSSLQQFFQVKSFMLIGLGYQVYKH